MPTEKTCSEFSEQTMDGSGRTAALRTIGLAAALLIAGQFSLFILEWIDRAEGALLLWPADNMLGFVTDLVLWPVLDPLHWGLNAAIVLMIFWFLVAITGRPRLAIALGSVSYVLLAIINHLKVLHLGMPVSVGDIGFAGFALRFMLRAWGIPGWVVWIPVLALAGACVWIWRHRRPPTLSFRKRLLWGLGSGLIALLLTLALHSSLREGITLVHDPTGARTQLTHSQEVGINLGLALELIPQPSDESDILTDQETERLASGPSTTAPVVQSATPHVIFWLSESFWDPRLLPNVSIKPDPLAVYQAVAKEGRAFNLLVPTYGGYTSRTMFEMVTGMSNAYVPTGLDAFTNIVSKAPCPSLARLFSARGYETVAIRAGMGDLFAGKEAYDMLGFDHYDTEDNMPHAARVRGDRISDQALSDYVVQRLETSPKPMFMFLASIQNHAPFEARDYPTYNVRVMDPTLKIVNGEMMSFIEGIYEADQALGYLVDRLEHDQVPVVLVFYGDHLPYLTPQFVAAKFLPERGPLSLEDLRRKHTTPGLIWTNTSLKIPQLPPQVSPQAVVAATLETLDIQHPFFTTLLNKLTAECPAFSPDVVIQANGSLHPAFPDTPAFRSYERVQRSILERQKTPKALFPEGPH